MKHTRLVLALLVTTLAATPALAASLTMLQFGSFETRDEAEKKLADISGKYQATLGTLPTTIREVKLPPDNLTVYRTQAGPVADRATAQSICAKLSSTGDECYIVQTAMVNAPAASAIASAAPLASDHPMATSGAAPDITSKLSMMQPSVETRDPLNRAALASVSTPLADTAAQPMSSTEMTAATEQSPEMRTALDKAVADQSAVANDVNTSTTVAQNGQRAGFWSHLNPFSASAPEAAVAATPEPIGAPVETVTAQALPAPVAMTPPAPVTTSPNGVAPMAAAAVTAPAAMPTHSTGFSNTPVITQPPVMQLPPPPAPLKAQDRAMLNAGRAPLPAPEPVAAPIHVAPLPPGVAAGTVQVEEAKRVPVTTGTTMPLPRTTVPVAAPFMQAPVSLQPGSTEGIKTIWAQIGPFASNDEALAYWASYRQEHPDFPVVRVRVTSSYQQLIHGVNSYSLRVGPMAQKAFVSSLCASLTPPDQKPTKQCGMVSDLGSSTPLTPATGMLAPSRYLTRH